MMLLFWMTVCINTNLAQSLLHPATGWLRLKTVRVSLHVKATVKRVGVLRADWWGVFLMLLDVSSARFGVFYVNAGVISLNTLHKATQRHPKIASPLYLIMPCLSVNSYIKKKFPSEPNVTCGASLCAIPHHYPESILCECEHIWQHLLLCGTCLKETLGKCPQLMLFGIDCEDFRYKGLTTGLHLWTMHPQ